MLFDQIRKIDAAGNSKHLVFPASLVVLIQVGRVEG
jgi:hypothetical protein